MTDLDLKMLRACALFAAFILAGMSFVLALDWLANFLLGTAQ